MKTVLITGAAGQIGHALRQAWQGKYRLRLTDIAPLGPPGRDEECVLVDIADLAAMEKIMAGVDAVAHFGGQATEASWAKIFPPNITGVHNILEVARRQGVQRVVLASSNHAVGFYRREVVLHTDYAPRPDGCTGRISGAGR